MPTTLSPIRLMTETQPGKERDPQLWQQMSQIQQAINQLLVQTVVSIVRDYTANANDAFILANTFNGPIIVTLPPAASFMHAITVKKADATGNAVTVVGQSAQTIDGAASAVLSAAWVPVGFISDGKNWYVI